MTDEYVKQSDLCVARLAVTVQDGSVPVRVSNLSDKGITLNKGTHIAEFEGLDDSAFGAPVGIEAEFQVDSAVSHLEEPHRSKFANLLTCYRDVFTGLGRTDVAEYSIPTGNSQPVYQGPRPIPGHLADQVKAQLDGLVDAGMLEEVESSRWASPLVIVKRPHGGPVRVCGDFRRVNQVTVPSVQVIPRVDSSLQKLSGAVWFTSLDLVQAYHQLPVAEEDQEKTTVATEFGLYRYRTAPYELKDIPHSFNRALRLVLAGVPPETYVQYFDDLLIMSRALDEMHASLERVLATLRQSGLTLSLGKLKMCQRDVKFLGFQVSATGIQCDPEKTNLIKEWPAPTSAKEVRVFIGLCGYLRRHIRGYALLAKPLTKLTEAHRVFSWGDEEQVAFETLKVALVSAPVLAFPVFDLAAPPFLLDTDACGTGIGATLMQGDHVIAYASRALTESERQYSVTKRELLAAVWAAQHFRSYLVGRRFVLRTDHAGLQWLFEMQDAEGQLARWQFLLREFDFEIVHRKGTQHRNADALSRYPHPLQTDEVRYRWVCVPVSEDQPQDLQLASEAACVTVTRISFIFGGYNFNSLA